MANQDHSRGIHFPTRQSSWDPNSVREMPTCALSRPLGSAIPFEKCLLSQPLSYDVQMYIEVMLTHIECNLYFTSTQRKLNKALMQMYIDMIFTHIL